MLNKLKKVSLRDILGIVKFIVAIIPSLVYKIYLKIIKKELWLICETEFTARDNGYVFYKYMKDKHPEINCWYAIGFKCQDYNKVKDLGNIVKWASLKHYFLYMSSTKNISSHKEGNPNQTLFTILHLYLNLYNNRVFLQHGITYQNFPMFYKKNTKFKKFICGAAPEYKLITSTYGYSKSEAIYTGFARFDNLHNKVVDKDMILFIPTWRRWLNTKEDFMNSNYYLNIKSLLNSTKLDNILKKYNKTLYFYPHLSMQKYLKNFNANSEKIKVLDKDNSDIQEVLKKASLMITDYSSVFMDFSYMHKPIIYYQFDIDEFIKKHYKNTMNKTFFDFENDGFGDVIKNQDDLIKCIEKNIQENFKLESKYKKRIDNFFIINDNHNCERIFLELIKKG